MTHDELMAAYGEKYLVSECRLDASGRAVFELANDLLVYVESHPEDDVLLLQAAIATITDPDPRLLTVLLGGNFFYRGKKSAVTAYNIATQEAMVVMGLDTRDMEADDLEAALAVVTEEVEYWRGVIDDGDRNWDLLAVASGAGVDLARFGITGMA